MKEKYKDELINELINSKMNKRNIEKVNKWMNECAWVPGWIHVHSLILVLRYKSRTVEPVYSFYLLHSSYPEPRS